MRYINYTGTRMSVKLGNTESTLGRHVWIHLNGDLGQYTVGKGFRGLF